MRSSAPTAKQSAYLRRLAIVKGVTFTPPRTRAEASATIERLTRVQSTPASDLRRERRELLGDLERRGGSASVLESEIVGYGSDCQWLHSMRPVAFAQSGQTDRAG
ncbi:MAG: hypothetical protein H0X28_14120 [Solirubrobacterales bacterium]|nr:hypothetical protein [Solirubrobacterales bacterium]